MLAIDKDLEAIKSAALIEDKRLKVKHGSFTIMEEWVKGLGLEGKVNGILLDLGMSSPQINTQERGFSFLRDGPLDMRMNTNSKVSAKDWINSASEEEIERVIKMYGEEKFSRRIAKAIVLSRSRESITSTKSLADIVSKANPAWEKHKHPATRTFQAIRIFINNELDELKTFLDQSLKVLASSGRLAVISFHSLEDRIVKRFCQKHIKGDLYPPKLPVLAEKLNMRLKKVCRVRASKEEINNNVRSRSAILRIVEKIR